MDSAACHVIRMSLQQYRRKRDFAKTPEPKGRAAKAPRRLRFVVQKHSARNLHYDFRLELDGVLVSWAVPKGPSLDPADKRLAVHVEDHPLDYANFEGVIPERQYGAGPVAIWDRGTWAPDGDPRRGYREGHLKFTLHGEKLHGRWSLIRIKGRDEPKEPWLLIKDRDDEARPGRGADLLMKAPESVKSHRTVEDIGAGRRRAAPRATGAARGTPKAGREETAKVAGVAISHPDRVVYPEASITKLAVAQYYETVAPRLLPHIRGRPLSIVRCPDGMRRACFYQKHLGKVEIPGVDVAMIEDGSGSNPYIVADSVKALAGLAQMNVLELHVWGARVATVERPDTLVLDLDPDSALSWTSTVTAARIVRTLLQQLGLDPLLKTTGGKGLHIVVPLVRRHGWDEVKGFAQRVATHLATTRPDQFTATMSKEKRRGKIFVDYLRNTRGATAVAPYSLRARAGATVATPLGWDELSARVLPSAFTLVTIPERIARKPDPWADYEARRQRLTAGMTRALGD